MGSSRLRARPLARCGLLGSLLLTWWATSLAAAQPEPGATGATPIVPGVAAPAASPAGAPAGAAPATGAVPAPSAVDAAAAPVPAPAAEDAQARLFQAKCAGCHTIGGGKIGDAPDLLPSTAWPEPDLRAKIKTMEKNVGPLADAELAELATLLRSPEVRPRLAAEEQRAMKRIQAELLPGSPRIGERLFFAAQPLAAGGMACASCHRAVGRGGTLAVDLTGAFGRIGRSALIAALASPAYPVMQAAYADHPLRPQEGLHLVAYLERLQPPPGQAAAGSAEPPLLLAGLALAALLLGLLRLGFPHRAAGARRRLIEAAHRRRDRA